MGWGQAGEEKECSGKVHSPSLGMPWILLAFKKCEQHVSFVYRHFAVSWKS